ncbi:MAG TPA: hypothetical protein VGF16_16845 [Bryobacteraceae bacterium]|jgi:hypothetical protein
MNRALVSLIAVVLPLAAQQKAPESQPASAHPGVQRVFVLKYADPLAMADMLRVFGVTVVANTEVHAVAVASAFPDVIAAVDDAINRLDVPASAPQNVELTGYYVIGGASPLGSPLPKDLETVAGVLTNTSGYKAFRLLDALTIRVRAGQGAETAGSAGAVANGSPLIATNMRVRVATVSADGTAVRLDRLTASVKLPVAAAAGQFTSTDLNFNADLDLKAGQQIIAGRVGMNRDQALFLVLTAKIVK